MSNADIRHLAPLDTTQVCQLYRQAASSAFSGLARRPDEISEDYVTGFLGKAAETGVALGAFVAGQLVGEIHAARIGPRQFNHVLADLTVAVHPENQGQGIGSQLFATFFEAARQLQPKITRIELIARSGNVAGIRLYERLGFSIEGRLTARVQLENGRVEDDLVMALMLQPAA